MAERRRSTDDEQMFAAWVREHGPAVRGFLLAMVRRSDVADDLSQEVFCRAWQARSRYREQGSARAYLLRIADRLVCDRRRQAERPINLTEEGWKQHEPLDPAMEPSERTSKAEAAERLAAVLDRLAPMQRRVLLLRYFGQFGFAEIAEMVGCPLGTALSHCRRGLEALRRQMAEKP